MTPLRRLVTLFSLTLVFGSSYSQFPKLQQPARTNQEVDLLIGGSKANERLLLTLNNNRTDVLMAEATVYEVSGIAHPLPTFELAPNESFRTDLNVLLIKAGH